MTMFLCDHIRKESLDCIIVSFNIDIIRPVEVKREYLAGKEGLEFRTNRYL